jgi:hypothetical protein
MFSCWTLPRISLPYCTLQAPASGGGAASGPSAAAGRLAAAQDPHLAVGSGASAAAAMRTVGGSGATVKFADESAAQGGRAGDEYGDNDEEGEDGLVPRKAALLDAEAIVTALSRGAHASTEYTLQVCGG